MTRLRHAPQALLVDVRQPAEWRLDGHLACSANLAAYTWEHGYYLPDATFAARVAEAWPLDQPIVLLCADGALSEGAAAVLAAASFSDVFVVRGGLRAWEEAAEEEGLPRLVVSDDGEGGLAGSWA